MVLRTTPSCFSAARPAEPASTIWGDVGLIATLQGALSMSRSSLVVTKGVAAVGARMGREAVGEGGDMLGDFDESFSHRMEGPHSTNEAVIACVFVKGDRYYTYL